MNPMVDPQVSARGNPKPFNVLFPVKDGKSSTIVTREGLTKADILIVGHDISFREYLSNLLGQLWNVAVAINGLHALDMMRRRKFDLILSDARMPDMDGYHLVRKIRSLPAVRYCPIVLMIANPSDTETERDIDSRPDDYLIKGYAADYLITCVNAQLRLALGKQAAEENKAKDDFIAMLGHELRNSLSPIMSALQINRIRGETSQELGIVERQVGNLTRLVDDLLDVSRMVNGKMDLRKEVFEIALPIADSIEMVAPLLKLKRHSLYLDVPDTGLLVYGDRCRLAQVISNLLTNAGKYSEPGSRIDLSVKSDGDSVQMHVRDEGIGIAPHMLQRIFDLFVQQGQGVNSRGGLGLGLAIVHTLVSLHGGTVTAASEGSGKGAEFIVQLPLHRGALPGGTREVKQLPALAGDKSKDVLIVDDATDAAKLTAQLLEMNGFNVFIAHDGRSALKMIEHFKPDTCLLDIGLPGMDGYELARRLRSNPNLGSGVRLVALTGYGQDTDRQKALDAGFDEHLVKPVNLNLLMRVIMQEETGDIEN